MHFAEGAELGFGVLDFEVWAIGDHVFEFRGEEVVFHHVSSDRGAQLRIGMADGIGGDDGGDLCDGEKFYGDNPDGDDGDGLEPKRFGERFWCDGFHE